MTTRIVSGNANYRKIKGIYLDFIRKHIPTINRYIIAFTEQVVNTVAC